LWLDDPSNESETFERVRVRRALAGDAALAQVAKAAAAASGALASQAREWLGANSTCFPEGYGMMPRAAFNALPLDLRKAALRRLVKVFAGGSASPAELQGLCEWLEGPALNRRTLGGAIFAARSRHVVIGREWARIRPQAPAALGPWLWDNRFQIEAEAGSVIVAAGHFGHFPRRRDIPRFVWDALPAIGGKEPRMAAARFMACLR
jgi:tRNA(Ile)-lysidine synthase